MFVLRDDPERNHVIDQLIETARAEVAKTTSGRLCGQAMTSVIVPVNHKLIFNQNLGQLSVAANVLAKSVSDLNDSTNVAAVAPFHAGDGKAVIALKLESL